MKCYYHTSTDAVAICKNCSRGVCQECAVDVVNGIACKDKCESEVKAVNQMISRGKTAYQKTSAAYSRNAIVYLMLGALFVAVGGVEVRTRAFLGWFLILGGAVFLIGSILNYSTGKKFTE
jgi:hypothetical protein